MKAVGIGLIGCGEIAAVRTVPSLLKSRQLRIVATMDTKRALAKDLAAKTGAAFHADSVEELLKCDAVEAVIISTPHHLHVPLGIKAARSGRHVLVEKPIATSLKDANRLIAACRKARVKLSVLYPMRFEEHVLKSREIVKKGALGRVTGFSLICMTEKPESYWTGGYSGRVRTDWRTKKTTSGGGYLVMNFTHNIDCIQNILNLNPASVYAQYDTFRTKVEVEDYVSTIVRYTNGAIGTFLGSTVCPGSLRVPDHIYGTHGTLVFGNPLRVFTRRRMRGLKQDDWTEIALKGSDSCKALLENFAGAIRGTARLVVTAESALSSLRVIEAAYKSQTQQRPVLFRT